MNRIVFATACVALAGLVGGCSFAARSPEMYRDDTGKVLDSKKDAIHACYDGVLKATPGVAGKVTITFEVEPEQGHITNVAVDKANTTAPDPVAECVTKNVAGLAIAPPDANKGQGTWVYQFDAPPPPAPAPAPAAAKSEKPAG